MKQYCETKVVVVGGGGGGVVKLYFNTVNPFRREIYTNITKRDKNANYTN